MIKMGKTDHLNLKLIHLSFHHSGLSSMRSALCPLLHALLLLRNNVAFLAGSSRKRRMHVRLKKLLVF
jgi:hypothetical protein